MENKFLKYLCALKVPFNKSKEESWRFVHDRTIGQKEDTQVIFLPEPFYKRKSFWVGAAASLALVVSVGYLLNLNSPNVIVSDNGEIKQVELPDGSGVVLNAGSSLSYSPDNWTTDRLVSLEGEAFFNVKKGQSFVVQTQNGNVEVLGTSFNVYSRDADFNVSCKTGKVKVSNPSKSVILTPGLCTLIENGKLADAFTYEEGLVGIWQQREYYHFENVPISDVFEELERQFAVKFELNNVPQNIVVNADLNIKELDKALNVVCATYGLSADKSNNSVYKISKK